MLISSSYTSGEPVTLTLRVTVEPYDFSSVPAPELAPLPYSGSTQTPNVKLVIGEKTLVRYTDFTLTNHGTSKLGEHSYTLEGTGMFTGTITGTYEIVELQSNVTYIGNAVHEYGKVNLSISSNASSRVKYAYALKSDPETWVDGKPKELGEYIVRFTIPEVYGVIGSETTAEIRIVSSYIKEITASAKTIHLLAGQSVRVRIGLDLEEGVTSFNPSLYLSKTDTSSILSSANTTTSGGVRQVILRASSTAEGEADVRIYRSGKATDEVYIKVYVHKAGSTFQLPNIAEIRDEAFMETAANTIQLSSTTQSIGARAFKNASQLWQVIIPKDLTAIAADVLDGTEAVLLCPSVSSPSSAAAEEAGIPYVIAY